MRFTMTAVTGLLSRHQRHYVQRVSPIIIHESSSDPDTHFNSDTNPDTVSFDAFKRSLKTMVQSKNKTDKRFIDLHRVSQALISGVKLIK